MRDMPPQQMARLALNGLDAMEMWSTADMSAADLLAVGEPDELVVGLILVAQQMMAMLITGRDTSPQEILRACRDTSTRMLNATNAQSNGHKKPPL